MNRYQNKNSMERDSDEPSSNRKKSIAEDGSLVTNNQLQPAIFKLNADCFEDSFIYLSLRDLNAFGGTC